jgi:hypothetical protein
MFCQIQRIRRIGNKLGIGPLFRPFILNVVFRIRIRKFLGLTDPDPFIRGTDPDPSCFSEKC